jgi:sugar phosphate isomerase/epimerase
MSLSRRDLLKWSLGAGAALAAGVGADEVDAQVRRRRRGPQGPIPVALELYSLRDDCAKDLPRMIAETAKIGYKGVEFAGYHGRTAKDLRKMLDDNGLVCCGTHTGLDTLLGDHFDKTVEFNKTLGNQYLIVPWMPEERLKSAEAIEATAKTFNELADKARQSRMFVGYHAHAGDLKKVGDSTAWEILFSKTKPEVVMQVDTGNVLEGGGEPIALIKKFAGRSRTVHLKEHGGKPGAVLGEGDVKWKEVFAACESVGGTRWYIVEQEAYAGAPLDSCRRCFENLKKMGKV